MDGYLTCLTPSGDALLWSTFLGGTSDERVWTLDCDDDGGVVLAGWTDSPDFPTTPGGFDTSHNGDGDVFLAKLQAGSALRWGSFFGGIGPEEAKQVRFDYDGHAIVIGQTSSSDFPTTEGVYDRTADGGVDAFLSKLDLENLAATGDARGKGPRLILDRPRPCPATDEILLRFDLPSANGALLEICDVMGRVVARWREGDLTVGSNAILWRPVTRIPGSGVYFVRLDASGMRQSRKALFLH
jgi:hypothetical protein